MKNFGFLLFSSILIVASCTNTGKNEALVSENTGTPKPLFTILSPEETGVDFVNVNEDNDEHNVYKYAYYYNGGGVAVADFNNDGLQDLVFTSNMEINKLYLNKGNFKFDDITKSAGINAKETGWATGVTTLDINNDGFEDIYICRSGYYEENDRNLLDNLLFINNGDLTFTESAKEYGLDGLYYSTQACFFDFDNDGDLDMYLLNHPNVFKEIRLGKDGKLAADLPNESKFSDQFFINENQQFVNVTKKFGLENRAHGLGVVAFDYNNDGFKDIYVSNDFKMPNILLKNLEGKGFADKTEAAIKHMAKFSMGCDFGDINNDGFQDIIELEMLAEDNFRKKTNMLPMNTNIYWEYVNSGKQYQDMHNCLQLNNSNETFSEIAWLSNIAETDWSWSPLLADFDNDGFQDLYVTNGFKRDIHNKDLIRSDEMNAAKKNVNYSFESLIPKIPSTKVSNYMFRNNSDLTFANKTEDWGLFSPAFSYGSAYADLDNDGNLDLVVNNMNDTALICKNNGSGKNYVKFYLKNGKSFAYGSKIEILDPDFYQAKELENAHGYLSKSEDVLHFGVGTKKTIDSLKITWFDNKISMLYDVRVNKNYTIDYKNSDLNNFQKKNQIETFFKAVNTNFNVNYVHKEVEYDDYKKEVLLPHKLSQEGPFIDVADINNDGLDDFFVGNGKGFAGEMYIQQLDKSFVKTKQADIEKDKNCEDLGVLFFDYDGDGDKDLYVVSGSNEYSLSSKYLFDRLYQNDGLGNFTKTKNIIPEIAASGSCVTASDVDNDGDLDLFVGGFLVPGQYPKAGKSSLLINENGVFVDKTSSHSMGMENIGMVKDAVFADVNGDSSKDLIIVGHWMPISIFINSNGSFTNETETYGLQQLVGWWNTVYVDDFNKDGMMDFAAGNLGLNSKHKASEKGPFKIIAKDFDNNGTNDIALGYYKDGSFYPVRGRECSSQQVPDIKNNFKSYTDFGYASFDDLYGHYDQTNAIKHEATMFETAVFINQKTGFAIRPLPNDCQYAPTNAFSSIDINGDGNKELISVGNFHPIEVETGRYDAHIGNVIGIDASGKLNSVSYRDTGFFTDGDTRSMKQIKIGGKIYLAITNNRGKINFIETSVNSASNRELVQ